MVYIPVCVVVTSTAVLGALIPRKLLTLIAVTMMEYVVYALNIASPLPCTVILVDVSEVVTAPKCVLFLHTPTCLAPLSQCIVLCNWPHHTECPMIHPLNEAGC